MAGPWKLNIVSLTLYLVLAVAVYGSYKYVPVFMKRNDLESLVKEESFAAKRKTADELRFAIQTSAKQSLGVELNSDDIIVELEKDRALIDVFWRVDVAFPFDHVVHHKFKIHRETIFY